MADNTPIAPWGATVGGVVDLLPQAAFPETLSPGQKGVSKVMVTRYLTELSGMVALRLAGYERLTDEARQAAVLTAARDLVHNGAASYAQAARFPEQASPNKDSYSTILWERYRAGLELLATQLDEWLEDPDDATPEGPAADGLGASYGQFPDPYFHERMAF